LAANYILEHISVLEHLAADGCKTGTMLGKFVNKEGAEIFAYISG
jgi:hypothetical protein